MKMIGLTGRSGCGKSSVTSVLRELGYPVVDGDQLSREILLPGSPCLPPLQAAFGDDILFADGTLNRRLLADRAFATPEGTKTLTEITFPEILRRIHLAKEQAEQQGAALFFVDGAVIIDTPLEAACDTIVLVTVPYEESVRRICARDGISAEMARRRLDAQIPQQELERHAHYRIENHGTLQALRTRTQEVLQALLE